MKKKEDDIYFCTYLVNLGSTSVTQLKNYSRLPVRTCILLSSIFLIACSIVRTTTDKVAQIALEAGGAKIPTSSPRAFSVKTVWIRIDAAKNLNADDDGRGLSTIVRIYKLKDKNGFLSAPYAIFGHTEREKLAFGNDLMDVRELILAPGQRIELAEKMTDEIAYLGVATLFRSPEITRWRFVFPTTEAESSGVTLGVHACAMTATSLAPSGMALNDVSLLSSVKCI